MLSPIDFKLLSKLEIVSVSYIITLLENSYLEATSPKNSYCPLAN